MHSFRDYLITLPFRPKSTIPYTYLHL